MKDASRRSARPPAAALLLLLLCCGSRRAFGQPELDACQAQVHLEMPSRISPGSSADIQLDLGQHDPPTTVILFPDAENYDLDRSTVRLQPGGHESVHLQMHKEVPGLVKLTVGIAGCKAFERPIDAGFSDCVSISVDNRSLIVGSERDEKPPSPSEPGAIQYFRLRLSDLRGRPMHVASPLAVELQTQGDSVLSKDEQSWSHSIEVQIKENEDQSELAILKTPSWKQDDGSVYATIKMDSSHDLAHSTIRYSTQSPWWVLLLAITLGSLVYSVVETLVEQKRPTLLWLRTEGIWRGCVALVVGSLGYLFIGADWMGVKLESSTLRGHFLFGILIGCFGLEGIYKKLKSRVDEFQAPDRHGRARRGVSR